MSTEQIKEIEDIVYPDKEITVKVDGRNKPLSLYEYKLMAIKNILKEAVYQMYTKPVVSADNKKLQRLPLHGATRVNGYNNSFFCSQGLQ